MSKNKKSYQLRAIVITAIMGALGTVLMMIEFSIPIMPSFIKVDFSELPALITSFAFGPFWGVLVCLIKNLIHLIFSFNHTYGIGEASNFMLGAIFVGIAGILYKKKKTKVGALISCSVSTVIMSVFSVFSNYFIIYPLYILVLGFTEENIVAMYSTILPFADNLVKAILIFNLPFNLVKMMIVSLMCFFIYKRLAPILKKN